MLKFLERYWVTLLGLAFLFGSFFTLFEMALDNGWLPPSARAAVGLVSGATVGFVGFRLYKTGRQTLAEIVAGLSTGIFFLTIAYASFSEHIMWSPNILLISMIALGSLIMAIGYRFQMRILVLISVLAGLLTPLIIRATPDQVTGLFLYVLVLNVVSLLLSVIKQWDELRIVSFFTTALIFITYYFYFDPESWGRPFFYVTSLFVVYMVGLFATSKVDENRFSGLNFYLGIINAIHYIFWSLFILSAFDLSYAIPALIVSLSFVGGAIYIHLSNPKEIIPALAYLLLGLFTLAISGEDFSHLFSSKGMPYVVNGSLWLAISLSIFTVGQKLRMNAVRLAGIGAWFLVIVYWYAVAWEVEWIPWFGVRFVPFINPGAMLWMAIATSAFVLSRLALRFEGLDAERNKHLSVILATLGHIVVGGLLTIQIQNLWEAYTISTLKPGIVVSTSWFLYAFGLFLWGKFTKTKVFLWLGGLVLVVSSLKMWLWDLPGESGIYKVLFLALSGGVILLVGFVHRKWMDEDPSITLNAEANKSESF